MTSHVKHGGQAQQKTTQTSTLIEGISELTTNEGNLGGTITDAAVVIQGDTVVWVGKGAAAPAADTRIDLRGRAMLPGWVDSHTHMVFAGDRTSEFRSRMSGETYAAGGINTTVRATRAATDVDLSRNLEVLVTEARRGGTTAIETKTGYGLTIEDEVRSAGIAGPFVDAVTFLGAHVVPDGEDAESYVELVVGPMLEAVAPFVSAIDVFCEDGAFNESQTRAILESGARRGLDLRVHGNQLRRGPGVRLAVEYNARSVDHLGFLTDEDIHLLADSWRTDSEMGTVATVLPACDLSTRMPLAPARRLLESGAVLAIATNCNPGSSYTTSMSFCVAIAVLQMGLSIEEAVGAATFGGAVALGMHQDGWKDPQGRAHPAVGSIREGARADLHVLNAPSAAHLAYRPGVPLTCAVWRAGMREV